jgi:hypothetical protein
MVGFVRQERPSVNIRTTIVFFRDLIELAAVKYKVKAHINRSNLPEEWVAWGIKSIVTFQKSCLKGFDFFSGSIHKPFVNTNHNRCVENIWSDKVSWNRCVDERWSDIVSRGLRRWSRCRWLGRVNSSDTFFIVFCSEPFAHWKSNLLFEKIPLKSSHKVIEQRLLAITRTSSGCHFPILDNTVFISSASTTKSCWFIFGTSVVVIGLIYKKTTGAALLE